MPFASTPPGDPTAASAPPSSVLFLCGRNAVRSPMAATLARNAAPSLRIASAGVAPGDIDPFVDSVLAEVGLGLGAHHPLAVEALGDTPFDLVITLSPQAHHRALELTRTRPLVVEYWPMPDPTLAIGSRSQILDAYRDLRTRLAQRIRARFSPVEPR